MRFQGFNRGGVQPPLEGIVQERLSVLEGVEKEQDSGIEGLRRTIRGRGTVIVSSFGRKLIMEVDRSGNIVKHDFPLEGRILRGAGRVEG